MANGFGSVAFDVDGPDYEGPPWRTSSWTPPTTVTPASRGHRPWRVNGCGTKECHRYCRWNKVLNALDHLRQMPAHPAREIKVKSCVESNRPDQARKVRVCLSAPFGNGETFVVELSDGQGAESSE